MHILSSVTPMNITILVLNATKTRSIATTSANPHVLHPPEDNCWWVSRVFVQDDHRGKGLGSKIVSTLLAEISKQGGKSVIVTPGGYRADPSRQIQFYERLGFIPATGEFGPHWVWFDPGL
jgi:GNAT superfamily N-acetyltransferase